MEDERRRSGSSLGGFLFSFGLNLLLNLTWGVPMILLSAVIIWVAKLPVWTIGVAIAAYALIELVITLALSAWASTGENTALTTRPIVEFEIQMKDRQPITSAISDLNRNGIHTYRYSTLGNGRYRIRADRYPTSSSQTYEIMI